ncbi:hypothetical protein H2248_006625 [Termitomyces sp. 'cryptogamus']|nr:hypothetical protein H2248_006625 [Termitomyces sp. 'cryptogamus']
MAQTGIEKLNVPTRVKLRSSQILTSLSQMVSEFVQNSIDAGATIIDIGVDCEEWLCWVKDNGSGISKESLSLLASGLEEGRYGSSKTYQPGGLNTVSTFGFRGEALASAADLGCLEISSRTAHSRDTWSTITKGGKCLYSGPAVRWRRETCGTVVCIRDAFYNLPVRRLSHLPPVRTLDQIRQELETYSIVFPQIVFSLENTHEPGPSRGRVLRIPKTSSSLDAFRNLYGRALAEHVDPVNLQSDILGLEGFISLDGAYSKGYQFLYVNRHPIARCDLHQTIDSAFNASTFGKHALDEVGEIDLPRSNTRRPPRKSEKQAVYVLNITVPSEHLDNCMEPTKAHIQFQQKNAVMALLSAAVTTFLTKHGFIVSDQPSSRPRSNKGSSAPRKRRKIYQNNAQNTGTGCSEAFHSGGSPSMARGERDLTSPVPLCTINNSDDKVQRIAWTDPRTGQSFIVDSRTGNSYPQAEPPPGGVDSAVLKDRYSRRTIPCCAGITTGTQNKMDQEGLPEWLQKALQANRTYDLGENSVQKVSSKLETSEQPFTAVHQFHEFRSDLAGPASVKHHYRFRKEDLRRAVVINQVDTKFIACLIEDHTEDDDAESSPTPSPRTRGQVLILIDQHAADERIRVERFLNDLCSGFLCRRNGENADLGIQTKALSPPLPVLLTLHEAQRLSESSEVREAFRCWGFQFDLRKTPLEVSSDDDSSDSGYTQVLVESIPKVVGDKLLLGNELRDLVKGFLGQLETEGFPSFLGKVSSVSEDENEFPWLKALRWCPRELLDLINSKACRGAIMFNDSLGISQCEDLIRRLSATAFPFQCAHGRPSVVPLINLGMSPGKNKGSLRWSKLEGNPFIHD